MLLIDYEFSSFRSLKYRIIKTIRFSLSKYYVKELLDFESQINFNIHPQNQLNDDYDIHRCKMKSQIACLDKIMELKEVILIFNLAHLQYYMNELRGLKFPRRIDLMFVLSVNMTK